MLICEPTPATRFPRTHARLSAQQPLRIVCFGDSVTGVYYHTGGRRAYAEMLRLALRPIWPQAQVTTVNAGISGDTTVGALNRLQRDVLDHKPDLVTVMFGLNDMTGLPLKDFRRNLTTIIEQCRAAQADVLLCTPTSVISTQARPTSRLLQYCEAIREVGQRQNVPVSDCYAAFEALRAGDPLAWRLKLSDEIHPNMDGHKLIAEQICRSVSGRGGSLASAEPPRPAIPRTLARLRGNQTIRILAMPPYDVLIEPALRARAPLAKIEVSSWPTAGKTLAQIEEMAKTVRGKPVDLVLIAVPAAVMGGGSPPAERVISSYTWILNWSLSFGRQEWDVVGIAPSVVRAARTPEERRQDALARRLIRAQDLTVIERRTGDDSQAESILAAWLGSQISTE